MNYWHLAIDPGASGALAWMDHEGRVCVEPMPETYPELWDSLHEIRGMAHVSGCKIVATVEKVGQYHKGNAVGGAIKFATHCGDIRMALYGLGIATDFKAPAVWQRAVCGALSKDKQERKRQIREAMQRLYPGLKVTLVNADALGLLTYAVKGRVAA